jgi:hypothetical protein
MGTVLDLITSSMRLLNISAAGDSISAIESKEALALLNSLLGSWQQQKLLMPAIVSESFPLVSNQSTYTYGDVGSGANFESIHGWPTDIESAYVRSPDATDFTLTRVSDAEYSELPRKNVTSSYPAYYLYRRTYPLASVILYPVPTDSLTLYIQRSSITTSYPSINAQLSLPPGYDLALRYALACEMAPSYGITLGRGDAVWDRGRELLAAIQRGNGEPYRLLNLDLASQGTFSIYAG